MIQDVFALTTGPYIPKEHEKYDLLPAARECGQEVFSYPAELELVEQLIFEQEEIEPDEDGHRNAILMPYGYSSYSAYLSFLKGYADKYRDENLGLSETIEWLIGAIKRMNVKENWSIVRYVGHEYDNEKYSSLTRGRCYYWPCSKEKPVYEGVIDNEEFTSYLYPCTPESWEILEDPTGMATRALAGEADTLDTWYPELALVEGSIDALAAEYGVTAKRTRGTYVFDEEIDEGWSASETDPVDFACPGCGKGMHHDAWTLVNARKNPELAERLMEGTLFEFTCPSCGYTASLVNPCLFLDPEHRAYIYLVTNQGMAEGVVDMFDNRAECDGPTGGKDVIRRIVWNRHDLRGKAIALANGLDDRIVEILKVALVGMAKTQGVVPMDDDSSVVNLIGMEGDDLLFRLEHGDDSMKAVMPRGGYEMYADAIARSSAAEMQSYYVDREFAYSLIDVIEGEDLL